MSPLASLFDQVLKQSLGLSVTKKSSHISSNSIDFKFGSTQYPAVLDRFLQYLRETGTFAKQKAWVILFRGRGINSCGNHVHTHNRRFHLETDLPDNFITPGSLLLEPACNVGFSDSVEYAVGWLLQLSYKPLIRGTTRYDEAHVYRQSWWNDHLSKDLNPKYMLSMST